MTFHQYPKIANLTRLPEVLACDDLVVTEKIHGTNARFGWVDGRFRVGSRTQELAVDGPITQHFGFLHFLAQHGYEGRITTLPDEVKAKGFIVFGEYFGGGIQREIKYWSEKNFRAFDVMVGNGFLDWDSMTTLLNSLGIPVVPQLYRGGCTIDSLMALRDGPTLCGEGVREGVVVKPSKPRNIALDLGYARAERLIAKFKSPGFEEERSSGHKDAAKVNRLELKYAEVFADEYTTPQRLEHVIASLREQGVPEPFDARKTGLVLGGMAKDIAHEGIHDLPSQVDWKLAAKLITHKTKALFQKWQDAELKRISEVANG